MALRKHNLSLAAAAAALAACVPGCGRASRDAGGEDPGAAAIADLLRSPPALSSVALGSRDVVAYPPAGALKGALLLRLSAEPGATVRYRLASFAEGADAKTLTVFAAPLYLLPPVTVWAQAEVAGQRGPVRSFAYDYDVELMPALQAVVQTRLPTAGEALVELPPPPALTSLAPVDGGAQLAKTPALAQGGSDWAAWPADESVGGRGRAPEDMPYLDLAKAEAGEDSTVLVFKLTTRAPPLVGPQTAYGFDFGPSHIAFASFGKGAEFLYRAEVTAGKLAVTRLDTNQVVPLSAASQAVVRDVVAVEIAKADLPALADAAEVVVRAYAADNTSGTTVNVHLEPFFFRSRFAEARGLIQPSGDPRLWRLELRAEPRAADAGLAAPYGALAAAIVPELERFNRIRFYTVGTLPLWFVAKDDNGYTGLNTSDRGVLTTLGEGASLLAKAQLLAHEFAHYQNARNSKLTPRWLQEGMSEWSAERFLYRHFPARAVHKYLRELRFDRYFDTLDGAPDTFPLAKWGTEPAVLGYEKSLMFLDLLEARLGQDALLRAFAAAVNEPMDSAGFQAFLEQQTGKDLTSLFAYWVNPGAWAPDADPYKLFRSADGDELLGLDEEVLGTDPGLADSRGDGYLDSEAYYLGKNLKVSAVDPTGALVGSTTPVLVTAGDPDTSAPLRLGGAKGAVHHYSLNPFAAAPELTYGAPQLLRAPYRIAAQTTASGRSGAVVTLDRPLYVGGARQTVALDPVSILPLVPRPAATNRTDLSFAAGVGRGGSDLPLAGAGTDLPARLGAYNLMAVSAALAAPQASLTVTVATRAPPSAVGDYGDYVVSFDNTTWTAQGPTTTHRAALQLTAGAPLWHAYDGGGFDTVSSPGAGLAVRFAAQLTLTADLATLPGLAAWAKDPGDQLVCVSTQLVLEAGVAAGDRLGCVTLAAPQFSRLAAAGADHFGLAAHTLELFATGAALSAARTTALVTLGQSALAQFEAVLGRPLQERHYWPVHLDLVGDGLPTYGSATVGGGAYLSLPASQPAYRLDYLFVEQLARQVMADLLARAGVSAPFWLQEAFIQWLTSSALYRIYPTRDVHQFHADRTADYLCYKQGVCPTLYASDDPLSVWSAATPNSTGSVKSLLFALELDAAVGADVLGEVFSTFANAVPTGATLKSLCLGFAPPAKAAQIAALWAAFVDGNDAAWVAASLADPIHDGLYHYEKQKLGTSDSSPSPYLN